MQLTLHTDYSLRVLMYLAQKNDKATIREIAEFHGISRNHLVKVVHQLGKLGYLKTLKGSEGGLLLAARPETIGIADVVQNVEPHFKLVECFDMKTNTCPIATGCVLAGVIGQAQSAFLNALSRYTLADLVPPRNPRGR